MSEQKPNPAPAKYPPPMRETLEVALMGGLMAAGAGFAFTYGVIQVEIDGSRSTDINPLAGGLISGGCCFLLTSLAIYAVGRLPQSNRFLSRLFVAIAAGLGTALVGCEIGSSVIYREYQVMIPPATFPYSVPQWFLDNHAKADLNAFLVGTSCGAVVGISTFMLFQPPGASQTTTGKDRHA